MGLCVYEAKDGYGHIELNRPQSRNALNVALLSELHDAVARARAERCRAILLSGAGPVFCAGADLHERGPDGGASVPRRRRLIADIVAHLRATPVAIAAVQGAAVGGGWALALACDVCLITPDACLSLPEVEHGIPILESTLDCLVNWLGSGPALAVALTGAVLSGDRFAALGAATVVAPENLLQEGRRLARSITSRDAELLLSTKAAVSRRNSVRI